MLNNSFFREEPRLFFTGCVYSRGLVLAQACLLSGSEQLWTDMAQAGSWSPPGIMVAQQEPDCQTGEKVGEGHSVCSPGKEPNCRACVRGGEQLCLASCFLLDQDLSYEGAVSFASSAHYRWCRPTPPDPPAPSAMARLLLLLSSVFAAHTPAPVVKSVCPLSEASSAICHELHSLSVK